MPSKIGPPIGALNGLKNGSRIQRSKLVVGNLPKSMVSVKREALAYRRVLEEAIEEVRDRSITDDHLVDAASAATMSAGICRWLLRNRFQELKASDIIAINKEIRKSKEDRAKIVRALELDAEPEEESLTDVINAEYTTKTIEDQR